MTEDNFERMGRMVLLDIIKVAVFVAIVIFVWWW
jgi:hypothetical protein